jgi:DNA-directed RNA polymerase subunit RPC12/RpoP
MTTTAPPRTFADLEPAGLELEVTCQRCGHVAVVDDTAQRLRNQRPAGRRYRCAECGAIDLPSLGPHRLAEHASRLRVDMSGGELPGRKVDPRR